MKIQVNKKGREAIVGSNNTILNQYALEDLSDLLLCLIRSVDIILLLLFRELGHNFANLKQKLLHLSLVLRSLLGGSESQRILDGFLGSVNLLKLSKDS